MLLALKQTAKEQSFQSTLPPMIEIETIASFNSLLQKGYGSLAPRCFEDGFN